MINNSKVITNKLFTTTIIYDMMWDNDVIHSSINHKGHMGGHW
jgi:hypothetical protein